MRIEWTVSSLADLDRFAQFLHERDPALATRIAAEIRERAKSSRTSRSSGAGLVSGKNTASRNARDTSRLQQPLPEVARHRGDHPVEAARENSPATMTASLGTFS
jgi:hypothetical protein